MKTVQVLHASNLNLAVLCSYCGGDGKVDVMQMRIIQYSIDRRRGGSNRDD